MKAVIPCWHGRVSPVFDVAQNLLLVEIEQGREITCVKKRFNNGDSFKRVQCILHFGAEVLICGAISEPIVVTLQSAGVQVYANVCGPIDEVRKAYLAGTLANSAFCMPGFTNRRRRNRKRRGR